MKKKIYLLGMLLIIGCSPSIIKPPVEKENLENKGIGIVNFTQYKTIVGPFKVENNYNIQYIVVCNAITNSCFKIIVKEQYAVFPLKEGKYYLARTRPDRISGIMTWGTFDKKANKGTIASFEIKKNEVIYLGDISNVVAIAEITGKQNFYFCPLNNLATVELFIKEKYPFIDAEKIQYKPLEIGTKSTLNCD